MPPPDPDDELLLASLLAELSPEARDAVLLRLAGGLTSAEVAAVLGKRPDAVKQLVHRSLAKLRQRWREEVSS
ncbi:MAG TPA: sigma factor-like helix-turn-helix DNA-binding protein [Dehalococcoidia bacterium]